MEKQNKVHETLTDQAIEGSFWKLSSSIIQRIGGFIFIILLARFLLPEGFGLYNLVLSIALIFMIFSHDAINETFIRYMSENIKNKEKTKSFFNYLLKFKFLLLFIIILLLLILSYPLSFYIFKKPAVFLPLLLATCYIFILSLEGFFTSFFFVVRKVKYVAIKETVYQVLRMFLTILLFLVISSNPKVYHIFIILIITSLITLLFVFYKNYRTASYLFEKSTKISKKDRKRIIKFFFYLFIGSISYIFFGNIDTIMLGILTPTTNYIGLYRSAFILVSSIIGLLGFAPVLLPIFIQTHHLEEAFNKVFRYLMIIAIPAAFGLAILGNYFVVLFYGQEYIDARLPLFFLSFLIIFVVQISLFRNLFSTREKPQAYLPLLFLTMLVNVFLNYILIKTFINHSIALTITGVAIATLISLIFYNVGLNLIARRKLRIKTNLSVIVKPLIASIIMFFILHFLKKILNEITILNIILLLSSGILIYFFIMLLIKGIIKEDFLLAKHLLKKYHLHFLPR